MALQVQAALLPSALSVPKKGNLSAVVKEPGFLSVSQKAKKPSLVVRAVATPAAPVASPGAGTSKADGKKTLRQGVVCNAAIYRPTARQPTFTADGYEMSVGVNHLGHFLLARLMLDDLKKSDYPSRRLIILGSITGNTNTLAGNVPPKAGLGDLRGLAGGLHGQNGSAMIDGAESFDGAKAYKDSKICNMLTMQEFHRRYHGETGVTFASLYPGCIATTGLFREHVPLFRLLFPPFQKYITKGYVSEEEAGKRLAQVVSDPSLTKSGVYWSWNNNSASFENQLSEEASDPEKAKKVWELSEKLVGLADHDQ